MNDINEIEQTLVQALKNKTSFSYEECEMITGTFMAIVTETFKGEQIYIPSKGISKNDIYRRIRAKFNGSNHRELAKHFNYTTRVIYQILKNKSPCQNELIL